MAQTTSLIQNNGPNPATMVHVLLSNDDLSTTSVVELEVFLSIGGILTPIAHELFSILPLVTDIKTFNVGGAVAFEVQYNVSGTIDIAINIFSTGANGHISGAQGVLGSETQMISQLTPVP
ncbi:hypothetical protein ACFQZT_26930 [Paenibacillus sp. GCM10027628]|uniref:hypothetical protein n=1 Tax=Paenibacillus sp. GCM10027628 TaxID=3273413 RepID=UPI003639F7C2